MKRFASHIIILMLCLSFYCALPAVAEDEVYTVTIVPSTSSEVTESDVTATGHYEKWWFSETVWGLAFDKAFHDVTVSVPEDYALKSVTLDLEYPSSVVPYVSSGTVSASGDYALTVSFPRSANEHTLIFHGVATDRGKPVTLENMSFQLVKGITVEYTALHVHRKDENSYHEAVAPTCSGTGSVEYWDCTDPECTVKMNAAGDVIDDITLPIDPEAHDFGEFTAVEPVECTKDTFENAVCALCGETITHALPATGHICGEYTVTKAPTCVETGIESAECANCGEIVEREIPVDPEAHNFGEFAVTKEATCTEGGEEARECAICGEVETRVIPAAGHSCGEYTVIKASTCAETGTETATCAVCGTVLELEIPKDMSKHVCNEFVVSVKPTCVKPGVETGECTVCGGEVTRSIPVDPDAHKWRANAPHGLTCDYCHALKADFFGSIFSGGSLGFIIAAAAVVAAAAVAAVVIVKKKRKNTK